MDMDLDRDFKGLDARGAQQALAEELKAEGDAPGESGEEGASTGEGVEAAAEDDAPEGGAPEGDAPETEEDEAEGVEATSAEDDPDAEEAVEEAAEATDAASDPQPEWTEEEILAHMRMAEALVFAAAEPLDAKTIADRLPAGADVKTVMARLGEVYDGRGVVLKRIDGKWRFVTASDVAHVLTKEQTAPRKLSRAALETLAIIAYHQPCTRADIEDVRGVQVARGSLDQLLEIGWVRLRGKRRDAPGRPTLYGTSQAFLEHFGLESIQDLPGQADLKAAGLLDARLPPGFSVPTPSDADDEDVEDEDGEAPEFAADFMEAEEGAETGGDADLDPDRAPGPDPDRAADGE